MLSPMVPAHPSSMQPAALWCLRCLLGNDLQCSTFKVCLFKCLFKCIQADAGWNFRTLTAPCMADGEPRESKHIQHADLRLVSRAKENTLLVLTLC